MPIQTVPPSMVEISFDTRAEFISTRLPASVNYVMAAGEVYVRDGSGRITQDDLSTWSPAGQPYPEHFGAVGDGVTDDKVALQEMERWLDDIGTVNVGRRAVIDGRGRTYAIGSTLRLDGTDSMVVKDIVLKAIGSSWDTTQTFASDSARDSSTNFYMVTNNTAYSDFTSIVLDGDHLAAGWNDGTGSGRARFQNCQWWHFKKYGYHKSAGGGEMRMTGCQLTQYLVGDSAVNTIAGEGNYDAIGIFLEESDCKINNTNVRWCGTCYKANSGVQEIYNSHFVQGTAGRYARTNAQLIEWNPAEGSGSGELWIHNCYLDNGYSDFYDDKVNITGEVLYDVNDVSLTSFFRFYAYSGSAEPRATAKVTFTQWDNSCDLFSWESYDGNSWTDTYTALTDHLTDTLSDHQERVVELANTKEILSTSSENAYSVHTFVSPHTRTTLRFRDTDTTDGSLVQIGSQGDDAFIQSNGNLKTNVNAYELQAQSSEPAGAGDYSLAASDGTSSTNGFGTSGAGLYWKESGSWSKIS